MNLHEQLVLRLTLHEPGHTPSMINPYTCYTSEISIPRSCRDGSNPLVILIAICQCGNQFLIVGGTRTDQLLPVITTIVLQYTVHSSASRSNKHEFDYSTALRHTRKNHKQGGEWISLDTMFIKPAPSKTAGFPRLGCEK